MRMFVGSELAEKAEADQIALDAGDTVFPARPSPTSHFVSGSGVRQANPYALVALSRAALSAVVCAIEALPAPRLTGAGICCHPRLSQCVESSSACACAAQGMCAMAKAPDAVATE
ncbi:hypothetical protein [Streptomyces sp. NPDC051684]|uniref:hypothetical protein n=1 Tax=Streptomyces sp. NPDC051684 TaxID=3365670 RepID=UPI00378DC7E8